MFVFSVVCPVVVSINNGDVIVTSDGVATTVVYTCHSNYDLTSSGSLSCRTDGTWNDTIPSCGNLCLFIWMYSFEIFMENLLPFFDHELLRVQYIKY